MTDVAHASKGIDIGTIYLSGISTPNNLKSILNKISLKEKILSTPDLIDSEKL